MLRVSAWEPSAASGFLLPRVSPFRANRHGPAGFAVSLPATSGASGSRGASFCPDFRQAVILFTNVQGLLTGCLAPESPDGLWVSAEATTMGLYQLGILWAMDQKPCPVLAREGAEQGGSSSLLWST